MTTQIKGNDTSTFGGAIQTNESVIVSNRPIVVAKVSSATTLSSSTWTKIALDTTDVDTDSAWDGTTNYRFTVPSGKAGKYAINAMLGFNALTVTQMPRALCAIRKNGTEMFPRADTNFANSYIYNSNFNLNMILDLAEGDYIELWGWCSDLSGSPQYETYTTGLMIHKLIG